ncbi:hypothetical protein AAU57_06525 [Nonlabens sp. YIK11]|uniref:hypothetical protein n=1 Tax=Nonlabens sp. YIK11 TaxID=1453349 RepID=UPI0006DCF254|nr:hypothetical protein [Nonlabens sp. YIK11]KQC33012.1 hypothetical protein AAU57_06525 [Nonlabens sp. YIK11]
MKILILILASFVATSVFAQDHYAVVKKNDEVTYNYPESSVFTLEDPAGNKRLLEKDDAIDVTGDYTLYIENYWSNEPEVIKANGGRLEVFILPNNYRNEVKEYYSKKVSHEHQNANYDKKPTLETKEITQSKKGAPYDLLAVFSNSLIFKFSDGKPRAWLNGNEVAVTNRYLVQSPEGLLKLSFNPSNGEFWYTFDTHYKY